MAEDERTVVKTYVPRYQKEAWRTHAENLEMSQSEFLRTMVQAGRRGFDPDDGEGGSADATPGGEPLETRVRSVLSEGTPLGWKELIERLTADFEDRVEDALAELQAEGRVQYSGRHGGYVLLEDDDE